MASVKKKPAAKKAAQKKAAAKKPAAKTETATIKEEELPVLDAADDDDGEHQNAPAPEGEVNEGEELPQAAESALTREDVAAMISDAVGAATKEIIAAVTQPSPQTVPDAPAAAGGPPVGMMTTYGSIEEESGPHEPQADLELLELTDPIGYQMAVEDMGGPTPGGRRVVKADVDGLESRILTKEQVESMTEEEVDAWNRQELARVQARKQAQVINRSRLEKMSPADRIRALTQRDPSRIRCADNPLNERMIKCVTRRRIGLGEEGTSDVEETVMVPISGARHLQEAGAIKVSI